MPDSTVGRSDPSPDDFLLLVQGQITSKEYVRRLRERVAKARREHHMKTPRGLSGA